MALPCTDASKGLGNAVRRSVNLASGEPANPWCSALLLIPDRLAPAQNTLPRPESSTARTAVSSVARCKCESNDSSHGSSMVLRPFSVLKTRCSTPWVKVASIVVFISLRPFLVGWCRSGIARCAKIDRSGGETGGEFGFQALRQPGDRWQVAYQSGALASGPDVAPGDHLLLVFHRHRRDERPLTPIQAGLEQAFAQEARTYARHLVGVNDVGRCRVQYHLLEARLGIGLFGRDEARAHIGHIGAEHLGGPIWRPWPIAPPRTMVPSNCSRNWLTKVNGLRVPALPPPPAQMGMIPSTPASTAFIACFMCMAS